MAPPSSAERRAAHWVADALAADEAVDCSVLKTLVDLSPEYLIGAPDSARERVALRCLKGLATFPDAAQGGAAVAPPPSKNLRVDAVRSCEDLLVELTGRQIGSSGILDEDIILPFRQDIQNFICIKKPALPESFLELLREVDPKIQSMAAPSLVEQNGIKEHDNHQSLCNGHHLNSNFDTPRPPASTELQPGNLTNLVSNLEKGNFMQCPFESTVDLDKPHETDRRFYNQPREYATNAASVGTRASEKDPSNVDSNMSGSSTSCNVTLLENIAEPLSKKSIVDESETTVVQPQPCKGKSSNPPDYNNVIKRPNDHGISHQSSKDSRHESKTLQATMTPAYDRSNDVLPTNMSEANDLPEPIATEVVQQLHSCKTHLNHLQHDSGQKVDQDLDGTTSIQLVEKYSIHEESTLRATSGVPSVSFNGAMQEDKSKTNYPSGNTTEHPAITEEQNCDKSQLGVSGADKKKHALHDDATMLGKNKVVCGSLNVQGAPESRSCHLTLHDKISEAHCLSDQNIGKSTNDIQKRSCNISILISCQDGHKKTAKQDSNKQTIGKTVAETSHAHSSDDSTSGFAAACLMSMSGKIPQCRQDQEANDSLRVSSEQNLCIKCGKGGQLLQCNSCLAYAHDSCFGSSVALEDPGQLYCLICICAKAAEKYKKTKKTYIEARKSLAAFLGAEQTSVSEITVDDLDHQGESNRQRKKQKINVTSDACNEVVIVKASSVGNSDVPPKNDSVLQNKSNQLQDAEQDHVENTEAHEGSSSQNRCSPAANPEVETDKEDGPTHSHHQSKDSDEIEFTSSSDSGKPSSPPWRTIKHHRERLQKREATVSSNSRKEFGQKDKLLSSPSRKRDYAYPPKRYSNPAVPTGRRTRLRWTVKEEAALREAMKKFTPLENGAIPWVQILEQGRDVFHRTRLPCDLRVKWRNMKNRDA